MHRGRDLSFQPLADCRENLPIVMLGGTLCDRRVFAPLIERMSRRMVVVPDMTGARSVEALAVRVLAESPPRFALLGFSFGGIVALEMAARAKERVAGLALICSTARPVPEADRRLRRAAVDRARSVGVSTYVREVLWPTYMCSRPGEDELRTLVVEMAEAQGVKVLADQVEAAITRADSRPRLATLTVPVLALCGEADPVCTVEMHREVVAAAPDAVLTVVEGAGHFALLERPDAAAGAVTAWLARIDVDVPVGEAVQLSSKGNEMVDKVKDGAQPASAQESARAEERPGTVLQVERRDYTQLAPTDRPRVQGLRGFDDIYTDIVDFIVRCTHRIWDERDVGLIYRHYTHNCIAYTTLGTMYDRETHIRDTIQRLVDFPDRRGLAQHVIWRGDDVDGFYTSHMTIGTSRHTHFGTFGKPTGRTWTTRTVADCLILENRIYKEWIVRDNMGPLIQLGIDPHAYAQDLATRKFEAGETVLDIPENRRLIGQYPPEEEADVSLAHTDGEAQLLRDLHYIFNKRMFGRIQELYAPNCQWHGPLMRELYGVAAVLQQTMRLVALIPDCAYVPQHICSVESEEGGVKYAVRWTMDGHHLGYGALGAPTGHRLFVMGVSHFHIRDGKIIDEWAIYDELSMLTQLKLSAIAMAA